MLGNSREIVWKLVPRSTLLVKLKEAPSPFAKVKQMIQDLISRLEDEAAAEASQKEWCDEEMKTATENRDKAQREIETLTALKMEKSALRDSLAEDITTLSQEVPTSLPDIFWTLTDVQI